MQSDARAAAIAGMTDRFPVGLVVLAFLLMLADGIDLAALPLAVPHIAIDLHRPPATFGLSLSAFALGFGIGALLVGPFGDRHGRRPLIVGSILLAALATGATGLATTMPAFVACRLGVGLALGGCLTNLNALLAELVPARFRARALTLMSTGIPLGSAAISFLIPPLIAIAGWRGSFFLLGAALLVVTVIIAIALPESETIRALRGQGRHAAVRSGLALASMLEPLGRDFRRTTLTFIGLYTLNAGSLYMLQSWLPTVLPQAGYSLAAAARMAGTAQIGGLVGGLIISTFIDRRLTMPALTTAYVSVAAGLIAFQLLAPGGFGWLALLLLVMGGISSAHLAIMALGAISYPPRLTASALGLATAVARSGAVGGPLYGQLLLQKGVQAPLFFLALLPVTVICVGLVFVMPAGSPDRLSKP